MLIHHQTLCEKALHEIRGDEVAVKLLKENPPDVGDEELERSIKIMEVLAKRLKASRYRIQKRNHILSSNYALLKHVSDYAIGDREGFEAAYDKLACERLEA